MLPSTACDELEVMTKDIFNVRHAARSKTAERMAAKLRHLPGGHMTREQFVPFVHANASYLKPAFELQQSLRDRLLGLAYWEAATRKRIKRAKSDPLLAHVNWRELFISMRSQDAEIRGDDVQIGPMPSDIKKVRKVHPNAALPSHGGTHTAQESVEDLARLGRVHRHHHHHHHHAQEEHHEHHHKHGKHPASHPAAAAAAAAAEPSAPTEHA